MARYSVADAKNNLPKPLDLAFAGEEVAITRRGQEIATIVPKCAATPLGLDWILAHQVTPRRGGYFDTAALVRRMRDEGY